MPALLTTRSTPPAARVAGLGERGGDLLLAGDVRGHGHGPVRAAEFLGDGRRAFAASRSATDTGALGGEPVRDGPADAGGRRP